MLNGHPWGSPASPGTALYRRRWSSRFGAPPPWTPAGRQLTEPVSPPPSIPSLWSVPHRAGSVLFVKAAVDTPESIRVCRGTHGCPRVPPICGAPAEAPESVLFVGAPGHPRFRCFQTVPPENSGPPQPQPRSSEDPTSPWRQRPPGSPDCVRAGAVVRVSSSLPCRISLSVRTGWVPRPSVCTCCPLSHELTQAAHETLSL